MTVVDRGHGTPVVVVPGIQGRWEWHAPAIDALAQRCRVLTFSYADEIDPTALGEGDSCIDTYCAQIGQAMAHAGVTSAALCGISYGGLVASVFAARNPDKVSSLILASALPPTWRPDTRVQRYLQAPRLLLPLFMVASLRMFTEIRRASPHLGAALRFSAGHAFNALTHMFSPTRMARRAKTIGASDLTPEVTSLNVPTLLIVGDDDLDRVVPVPLSLEYLRLVRHAEMSRLVRTGHIGSITRPDTFAGMVAGFITRHAPSLETRRRLG